MINLHSLSSDQGLQGQIKTVVGQEDMGACKGWWCAVDCKTEGQEWRGLAKM